MRVPLSLLVEYFSLRLSILPYTYECAVIVIRVWVINVINHTSEKTARLTWLTFPTKLVSRIVTRTHLGSNHDVYIVLYQLFTTFQ